MHRADGLGHTDRRLKAMRPDLDGPERWRLMRQVQQEILAERKRRPPTIEGLLMPTIEIVDVTPTLGCGTQVGYAWVRALTPLTFRVGLFRRADGGIAFSVPVTLDPDAARWCAFRAFVEAVREALRASHPELFEAGVAP
jgi:hypothetical protein